jgi:hypothetical protein
MKFIIKILLFFILYTSLLFANSRANYDFDCDSFSPESGYDVSGIEAAQVMLGALEQMPILNGPKNHSVFWFKRYETESNITIYSLSGAMTSGCTRSQAFNICIKRKNIQPYDRPSYFTYEAYFKIDDQDFTP